CPIFVLLSPLLFPLSSFFFYAPASTEIYTLSLHDALPIFLLFDAAIEQELQRLDRRRRSLRHRLQREKVQVREDRRHVERLRLRSEEHTSELQSPCNLVCRLLLEKKKKIKN